MSFHLRLKVCVYVDIVDEHGLTVGGSEVPGVTLETEGDFHDLTDATCALEAMVVNVEEEQDDARALIGRELDAVEARDERRRKKDDDAHRRLWAINHAMRYARRKET